MSFMPCQIFILCPSKQLTMTINHLNHLKQPYGLSIVPFKFCHLIFEIYNSYATITLELLYMRS